MMIFHPFHAPDRRRDPVKWLMLAGFFALSLCMFYLMASRPSSDISIHATWAAEGDFRDLTSFLHHGAHPMWHMLTAFLMLFGLPLEWAAAVITALCKVAEVWLIHRLMTIALHQRFSRTAITVFSAVCAMVSCLCVPFYNPTVYLGVGTPNTWHSCTQMIAMVWMLLCVPYTAWCFDHFQQLQNERAMLPWREPITLGVMLFLSLLAKPTFMQAFLPAACLFFLWQWIRHPRSSRFFLQVLMCVLPSIVFMIVQYLYYFGIIVPWQSSMVLELSLQKCLNVGVRVVLMQAFPLYTLWACRKQKKDTFFWLCLLFNLVGIVEFLILGEDGRRAADGNFGWGMMGAALMMWVSAMITFLREKNVARPGWRFGIGWVLLLWHLASGIYYVIYLLATGAIL